MPYKPIHKEVFKNFIFGGAAISLSLLTFRFIDGIFNEYQYHIIRLRRIDEDVRKLSSRLKELEKKA